MNAHNFTLAANAFEDPLFPSEKVTVGKFTYGPLTVHHFGNNDENLKIGSYCSISSGVKFILGGNHPINNFSTYAFKYFFTGEAGEAMTKGSIIVEDDVWIGTDTIILSGVTLGKGTVVAAGSIVTRSTPPYSVVAGNPARVIKMRFEDSLIKGLIEFNFNDIDHTKIKVLLGKLYTQLDQNLFDEIRKELLIK